MAPRKKANQAAAGLSEYEKLRQKRIQENKAKLAELGLDSIASEIAPGRSVDRAESSVPTKTTRRSARKRKVPSDSGDSGGDEEDQELLIVRKIEDDDYVPAGQASSSDSEDDELVLERQEETTNAKDENELEQAIALSLEESGASGSKRSRSKTAPLPHPKQKGRPARRNCFQLTDEEIDAMYHTIVGTGARLSLRELQLAATSNDFTWDLTELQEMISMFDTDKDGMLSLDEFRIMASRSGLVQGS